jgi:hypothetical protein
MILHAGVGTQEPLLRTLDEYFIQQTPGYSPGFATCVRASMVPFFQKHPSAGAYPTQFYFIFNAILLRTCWETHWDLGGTCWEL